MDGPSIIKEHGKAIINAIRRTTQNDWKVLVLDEGTKRIIDSSINEDDILNHNIANIERIEERREPNPDMDAVYLLSPLPHIVDCLLADFERRRYRRGFIIWVGPLPDQLARRLDGARRQMGAKVLCMHLARFVQEELDNYQQFDRNFPPPSQRPQSVLLITDRTMDLMAPLLHEFTYQAMAHDLLPIRDQENGKVTFHMTINENTPKAEEKDMELVDKDTVWVNNRHRHMKDTIDKLMSDFQKFLDQNPHFAKEDTGKTTVNDLRDMMAGLPQFQEMKQAYSLHLTMAQEAMDIFKKYKLADIASVEQTLATGLDEDYKKPKNVLDEVVRLLDNPDVAPADRLRLIALYVLYPATPLFPPRNPQGTVPEDEYALSRFEPALKQMLERVCAGDLDPALFPYVVPPLEAGNESMGSQASLRSAAPRWASANRRQAENRQRIIVFVAGGATYSEARACYEVSDKHNRDVFLATSHMAAPAKFIADLRALKVDRRRLDLPQQAQQAHPAVMTPGGGGARPPTKALAGMSLNSGGPSASASSLGVGGAGDLRPGTSGSDGGGKKKDKEKKKRNIFGIKK
ncbi:Sec1-like protein [Chaetomium sp. MPI-CAGE-AT-0009]|nr:Sec1-like protein [Chaetomium sp. MPI-CAGE-AT-0009]